MTASRITLHQNKLLVSGALTFATVTPLWKASQTLLTQQPTWDCDFSGVSDCDSAGLALMFEWIKLAKQQGKRLQFFHLPQQLHAVAKAAGLDGLLSEYCRSA